MADGQTRLERRERDRAAFAAGELDVVHGASQAYNWLRCRCPECVDWNAARKRTERERDQKRAKADPTLIPHGTPRGLTHWGCRCPRCRKAEAERRAKYPRYVKS